MDDLLSTFPTAKARGFAWTVSHHWEEGLPNIVKIPEIGTYVIFGIKDIIFKSIDFDTDVIKEILDKIYKTKPQLKHHIYIHILPSYTSYDKKSLNVSCFEFYYSYEKVSLKNIKPRYHTGIEEAFSHNSFVIGLVLNVPVHNMTPLQFDKHYTDINDTDKIVKLCITNFNKFYLIDKISNTLGELKIYHNVYNTANIYQDLYPMRMWIHSKSQQWYLNPKCGYVNIELFIQNYNE